MNPIFKKTKKEQLLWALLWVKYAKGKKRTDKHENPTVSRHWHLQSPGPQLQQLRLTG